MTRRPRLLVLTAAVAFVALASGCNRSATPTDFRKQAESELGKQASTGGVQLTKVTCETPGNTLVGTVFGCTAEGEAGEKFTFDVLIDAPKHLLIKPH